MKYTLNTHDIVNELRKDDNANWSHNGARALAEYLEEYEESTGEELELDVCAIRCDFSEYESLEKWGEEYFATVAQQMDALGLDDSNTDEELNDAIREYIQDNGTLIEFDGGIIVSSF